MIIENKKNYRIISLTIKVLIIAIFIFFGCYLFSAKKVIKCANIIPSICQQCKCTGWPYHGDKIGGLKISSFLGKCYDCRIY